MKGDRELKAQDGAFILPGAVMKAGAHMEASPPGRRYTPTTSGFCKAEGGSSSSFPATESEASSHWYWEVQLDAELPARTQTAETGSIN